MTSPTVKCSRCGHENKAGSNYCAECLKWIGPSARLEDVSTDELIEELAKRGNVQTKTVGPFEIRDFGVEGPATVLVAIGRTGRGE